MTGSTYPDSLVDSARLVCVSADCVARSSARSFSARVSTVVVFHPPPKASLVKVMDRDCGAPSVPSASCSNLRLQHRGL